MSNTANNELAEYFLNLATSSFNAEKILYGRIKEGADIFKNVGTLYNAIVKNAGFNDYLEKLKIAVFGKDIEWIKYLYDRDVIKEIVSTGTSKIDEMYGLDDFSARSYLKVEDIRGKRGAITKGDLEEQFKKISNLLSGNLMAHLSKDGNIEKKFKGLEAKISKAILEGLKGRKFRVKVFEPEKTEEDLSEQSVMSLYEVVKTGDSLTGKSKILVKANIRQILLTKDEIIEIIQNSTKNIVKGYDISYTKSESTFTATLRLAGFNENSMNEKLEDTQIQAIAEIFLEQVCKAIHTKTIKERKDYTDDIKKYTGKLAKMIEASPHLIREIYKVNTEASASGTIGEIMFTLLMEVIEKESASILGQAKTASGYAAVDILLDKGTGEALEKVGFQIKNYTSARDLIVLYSQTNKFYDESAMRRYVEESLLKLLYGIARKTFLKRQMGPDLSQGQGGENSFAEVENVLAKSLPNYIRYDLADLEGNLDFGKNNFYIINFKFVPSSVLFYTLYKALNKDIDWLKSLQVFFFTGLSGAKGRGLLKTNSNNLLDSWDKAWETISDDAGGTPNLTPYDSNKEDTDVPNIWKENLYLNFKGVEIKFKQELSFLWSQVEKG